MEIFAAGNKYKCFASAPKLIGDMYFVYAWKWNKSKDCWFRLSTYNIGPHYTIINK